jgi:hypothetical protein
MALIRHGFRGKLSREVARLHRIVHRSRSTNPALLTLVFLLAAVKDRSCMSTRYFELSHGAAISTLCRDSAGDATATWVERGDPERKQI